jgi:hypothetical protein
VSSAFLFAQGADVKTMMRQYAYACRDEFIFFGTCSADAMANRGSATNELS